MPDQSAVPTPGIQGNYSEKEFYTYSRDKRGFSDRMQVYVSPDLKGHLAAIIQSGRYPSYRTYQDFVRDAIIHRLHQLEVMTDDAELQATLERIRRREQRFSMTEQETEQKRRTTEWCEQMANHLADASNDPVELKRLVDRVAEQYEEASSAERGIINSHLYRYLGMNLVVRG